MNILNRLNIAMKAHMNWDYELKKFLKGQINLEAEKVENPDICKLSKCLREWKEDLKGDPDFEDLLFTHKELHKCAGNIVATHGKCGDDQMEAQLDEYSSIQKELFHYIDNITSRIQN